VVAASRYGKVDRRWDLRRDAVVRECTDQTDRRVGRSCRYYGEVGMLGFPGCVFRTIVTADSGRT